MAAMEHYARSKIVYVSFLYLLCVLTSSPLYHDTFGAGSPVTVQAISASSPWPVLMADFCMDMIFGVKETSI